MLTGYDYAVLAFFFAFMLGMGFLFKGLTSNSSDYFRSGGAMVWWLVGATTFMTQFSAWTFTGAAGKAYRDGSIIAVIFFGNAAGFLVNYFWAAERFRNLRMVTAIELVRERFGTKNEQVFTWLQVPISFIYAGLWLNGLAVFVSQAFGVDMQLTIAVTGAVVVAMSVTGGSWTVIASDFIQMLLLMAVAIVTFIAALAHPAVGGVVGFIEKVPAEHWRWDLDTHAGILWFWVIATVFGQIVKNNSMLESYRYLCAKDGKNARRGALLAASLMLIGPIIWFVPPMAARIIEPNIAEAFPGLKNPSEGAFVYIGMKALPVGMLGMLLCGIFAATMSSMDSGLNRNAGIFTKNFYRPILNPKASDDHLLFVGKASSLAFGAIIVSVALYISKFGQADLFTIMTHFGALVTIPYTVPLLWGLIVKRVPPWAAWTTVLVGFGYSLCLEGLSFGAKVVVPKFDFAALGFEGLTKREGEDLKFVFATFGNFAICTAWFLGTSLFAKYAPADYFARVDAMFKRMTEPVDYEKEEKRKNSDATQGFIMARACFVYGGFVALLAAIFPNGLMGRMAFVFCGGLILLVGWLLQRSAKRQQALEQASPDHAAAEAAP